MLFQNGIIPEAQCQTVQPSLELKRCLNVGFSGSSSPSNRTSLEWKPPVSKLDTLGGLGLIGTGVYLILS